MPILVAIWVQKSKVEVRWRTACLFLHCPLDCSSNGQELIGFCVLGMGSAFSSEGGWQSCKNISALVQFATCSSCSWGKNHNKYVKTLSLCEAYIKKGRKMSETKAQGCKSSILFCAFRSATDFSWLTQSCTHLLQIQIQLVYSPVIKKILLQATDQTIMTSRNICWRMCICMIF